MLNLLTPKLPAPKEEDPAAEALKHSATVIWLDPLFAHSDGLPCRSIWDDGGGLDVAKLMALRSGLGI
jgi:hypothetical protein